MTKIKGPYPKSATAHTIRRNRQVYALLDFTDSQEKEFAKRGLIAAPEKLEIRDEHGKIVWSQKAYEFLNADAPDTANPSLWQNAQNNHLYGLFEVTDGIWQVRGYDMTNITFIQGNTGWIIFDPLMSTECSKAALSLVTEHLGMRPVTGIIISHPHVDHYGGIKGIITEAEAAQIPVIAPEHFHEYAVSENVYAGNAMGRRAGYQYGAILEAGETGSLSIGIGMGQSKGTISYITPNDFIKETGEKRTIDGVEMEFQMTPGTEAPAEMNTWFPQKRALWIAENCTCTLHNLYTLRGAQVRDGNAWAKYIMEALSLYGKDADVVFQSHNWPHWGNEIIRKYLTDTASMYKFINDQTLMYINLGYTQNEIANMIHLPDALEKNWYTRQYYGTVSHNAKAVYQRFMGWYDANPVHLHPLTPSDSAKKLVEYLGNTENVLQKAKQDFDNGEYQWVAQITNTLVFANPTNEAARHLCADALEQLGYQAESGPWRNVYLCGAQELRLGTTHDIAFKATPSADLQKAMTPEMIFDQIGILLDANAAQDLNFKININLIDDQNYLLTINAGVVLYQKNVQDEHADALLTMPHKALFYILARNKELQKANIKIEGQEDILQILAEHMTTYDFFFNIIEP